ncbi:hypothetical protein TNCV_383711 [Trichonephila clavipes]|nr:hypothetical protein TNCV_383711 [Trichonephila clavipes]
MPIVSPRPSLIIFQDRKPLKGKRIRENTTLPVLNTLFEGEKNLFGSFLDSQKKGSPQRRIEMLLKLEKKVVFASDELSVL